MSCDIDRIFASFAARVPDANDSSLVLSAETVPRPAKCIRTDRLVIEKSYHEYDSICRREALAFHASKATYCNLGLLIAAVLFSPSDLEVTLLLDHPASNIRRIIVRRHARGRVDAPGFHSLPHVLNYYPVGVSKHPWLGRVCDPRGLPEFFLTNSDECVVREADWEGRDTVVGFGSDIGSARLVELLLNASRPSSLTDEFELEGEGGFRGVAPLSCEARFWLPGSFGWKETFWADAEGVHGVK